VAGWVRVAGGPPAGPAAAGPAAGGLRATRSSLSGIRPRKDERVASALGSSRFDRHPGPCGRRPRLALAPLTSPRTSRRDERPAELAGPGGRRLAAEGAALRSVEKPWPPSVGPLRAHGADVGRGLGAGLSKLWLRRPWQPEPAPRHPSEWCRHSQSIPDRQASKPVPASAREWKLGQPHERHEPVMGEPTRALGGMSSLAKH
jgi:hypothetical protein